MLGVDVGLGVSTTVTACAMTDIIRVACGRLEVITYGNLEKEAVRSKTDVICKRSVPLWVVMLPMYIWFVVGGALSCLCPGISR